MEKKEIVCYKCGKPFSVRQDALSDVCPNCMSFIDVVRAEREKGIHIGACETEKESAEDTLVLQKAKAKESMAVSEVTTVAKPEIIEKKAVEESFKSRNKTEDLIGQGKAFLEKKNWAAARNAFSQSLAVEDDWRGHFGILAAETRDLTDFASYDKVKFHAQKALKTLPEKDRKPLADRYLPRLESKRRSLVDEQNSINSEQNAGKSSIFTHKLFEESSSKQDSSIIAIIFLAIIFFVAGGVLLYFSANFAAEIIGVGIMMLVFSVVIFVGALKRHAVQKEKKEIEQIETSFQISRRTRTEQISRQIDAIDFICGLLKF